jgi:hypothetical protein
MQGLAFTDAEKASYGRALEALCETLHDPDLSVRMASAETLGVLGPPARRATDELTAALKADDLEMRVASAYALLKIGGDARTPALRLLAEIVGNPEPIPDRRALVDAMQNAGEPGQNMAVRSLSSLLSNEDGAVRRDAVRCVSALGPGAPRILPALEPLMKSKDPDLRLTSALAAMQTSDPDSSPNPQAVAILAESVCNSSLSLSERQEALAAIYSFGPEEAGAMGMVGFSVVFPTGSPRSSALRRSGVELARQLMHKDSAVRRAAAELLHMIDPENLAGKDEPIAQP